MLLSILRVCYHSGIDIGLDLIGWLLSTGLGVALAWWIQWSDFTDSTCELALSNNGRDVCSAGKTIRALGLASSVILIVSGYESSSTERYFGYRIANDKQILSLHARLHVSETSPVWASSRESTQFDRKRQGLAYDSSKLSNHDWAPVDQIHNVCRANSILSSHTNGLHITFLLRSSKLPCQLLRLVGSPCNSFVHSDCLHLTRAARRQISIEVPIED